MKTIKESPLGHRILSMMVSLAIVISLVMSIDNEVARANAIIIPYTGTATLTAAIIGAAGATTGDVVVENGFTAVDAAAFQGMTVSTVTLPNSVLTIGDGAFDGCTSLTSVTLPNTLAAIGDNLFRGCSALVTVTLPNTVTTIGANAFDGCTSLSSIGLPPSITAIGNYAFSNAGLISVVSPGSVMTIGDYAFQNCLNLLTAEIGHGTETIGANAFIGCNSLASVIVPGSVLTIGLSAFPAIPSLTIRMTGHEESAPPAWVDMATYLPQTIWATNVVTIPWNGMDSLLTPYIVQNAGVASGTTGSVVVAKGYTTIGDGVFQNCSSMTSVTILSKVTSIGSHAFAGCETLTTFVIPDGVTTIGSSAFAGCTNLTDVYVPLSVTNIAENAFKDCPTVRIHMLGRDKNLAPIWPDMFSYVGRIIWAYTIIEWNGATTLTEDIVKQYISATTTTGTIVVAAGYTAIANHAFIGCTALDSIVLPSTIRTIGDGAFYNCSSLVSISIPPGVESIGLNAFFGCASLAQILMQDRYREYQPVWPDIATYEPVLVWEHFKILYTPGENELTATIIAREMGASQAAKITIEDGYTVIGTNAFANRNLLVSITIPDSVTVIRGGAFSGCSSLTSVTIPSGVSMVNSSTFAGCTSLTSVTLPSSITVIGPGTFSGCSSLKTITLPSGVQTIGDAAFADCVSLETVSIPTTVTTIGSGAFAGCTRLDSVVLNNNITFIGDHAFVDCASLTYIAIPRDVTAIENDTFSGCLSLTNVAIPNSVTTVGDRAFMGCASLMSVALPESVVSIGNSAFEDCFTLSSVLLPNTLETIGSMSFASCPQLRAISIPLSVNVIGTDVFFDCPNLTRIYMLGRDQANLPVWPDMAAYNLLLIWEYVRIPFTGETLLTQTIARLYGVDPAAYGEVVIESGYTAIADGAFYGCTGITAVDIPGSVVRIGESAFQNCTNLELVNLPSRLISIGNNAFLNCTSLTSVFLPDSVREISVGMFKDCINLETVNIPSSVTGIGNYAFVGCTNLEEIPMSENIDTIGTGAFQDCLGLISVTVPSGVTTIGDAVFANCTSLRYAELPDTLSAVGYDLFVGASNLDLVLLNKSEQGGMVWGDISGYDDLLIWKYKEWPITFNTDGGSEVDPQSKMYGETVDVPETPTKPGYAFVNWLANGEPFDFGTTILRSGFELTAEWSYGQSNYNVEYYLEGEDGQYLLNDTVTLVADTATEVVADLVEFSGYVVNAEHPEAVMNGIVAGDGSLVLKVFYDIDSVEYRIEHWQQSIDGATYDLVESVTERAEVGVEVSATGLEYEGFVENTTHAQRLVTGVTGTDALVLKLFYDRKLLNVTFDVMPSANSLVRYGSTAINPGVPPVEDEGFEYWWVDNKNVAYDFNTPVTADVQVKSKWTGNNTTYVVLHQQEALDGGYVVGESQTFVVPIGTTVSATSLVFAGFSENTAHANRVVSGVATGDTQLELRLWYDRNSYVVTFNATGVGAQSVKYGGTAVDPGAPAVAGLVFEYWQTGAGARFDFNTPISGNTTLYPKWENGDVSYVVNHFLQQTDGDEYDLAEAEMLNGVAGTVVSATPLTFEGFNHVSGHTSESASGTITIDGSLELNLFYDRDLFVVTFDMNEEWVPEEPEEGEEEEPEDEEEEEVEEIEEEEAELFAETSVTVRYQARLSLPEEPHRVGYTFLGWMQNGEPFNIDSLITTNMTLVASWAANPEAYYTVEYYWADLDGENFTKVSSEVVESYVGETVEAEVLDFPGLYLVSEDLTGVVDAENSLVLTVKYDRNIYTLTTDTNYPNGSTSTAQIKYGSPYGNLPAPSRSGYRFDGWYLGTTSATQVTSSSVYSTPSDVTLYAHWRATTSSSGSSGGTGVTIGRWGGTTTTTTTATAYTFNDVKATDWYYEDVISVAKLGWMSGVEEDRFAPNEKLTRGQLVTIFARVLDVDLTEFTTAVFTDVTSSSWCGPAVAWGSSVGIINGYGDGTFGPDDTLTREQLAVVLHRYLKLVRTSDKLNEFGDSSDISDWARSAMTWATEDGILRGTSEGMLNPQMSVSRAETATIYYRLFGENK